MIRRNVRKQDNDPGREPLTPIGVGYPFSFKITEEEFQLFKSLIYDQTGICLSDHKKELVVSRLAKRLRALNLGSFTSYYRYLTKNPDRERELGHLVNRITTNKTDFFRESYHFDFLSAELLPVLVAQKDKTGDKTIRAWSAGSSTGEEPYSIALVMAQFFEGRPDWKLRILATDLDTEVLAEASRGLYSKARIEQVPPAFKVKYFLRQPGPKPAFYAVAPQVRQMVSFRKFNLHSRHYPIRPGLDFIFCRNVLIYFNNEDKIKILKNFHTTLRPGGHIFVGHSESLMLVRDIFKYVKNTVYQKI